MKKFLLISTVLILLNYWKLSTKEKLYLYTDVKNCNNCYSGVLDLVNNKYRLFDSLNIDLEIVLKCRRDKDVDYYRNFHKIDKRFRILKFNDSLATIFDKKLPNEEYYLLFRNDTLIFSNESIKTMINFLKKD